MQSAAGTVNVKATLGVLLGVAGAIAIVQESLLADPTVKAAIHEPAVYVEDV